jgi:hypothetical protein
MRTTRILAGIAVLACVLATGTPAWAGFAWEQPVYSYHNPTNDTGGHIRYSDEGAGMQVELGAENVTMSGPADGSKVVITSASGSAPALVDPLAGLSALNLHCLPSGVSQVTCTAVQPAPNPAALIGYYPNIVGPIRDVTVSLAGPGSVVDARALSIDFYIDLYRATGGDVVHGGTGFNYIAVDNGYRDTIYCNGLPTSEAFVDPVDVVVGDCGRVVVVPIRP